MSDQSSARQLAFVERWNVGCHLQGSLRRTSCGELLLDGLCVQTPVIADAGHWSTCRPNSQRRDPKTAGGFSRPGHCRSRGSSVLARHVVCRFFALGLLWRCSLPRRCDMMDLSFLALWCAVPLTSFTRSLIPPTDTFTVFINEFRCGLLAGSFIQTSAAKEKDKLQRGAARRRSSKQESKWAQGQGRRARRSARRSSQALAQRRREAGKEVLAGGG